jgi:DNA integrity scanning protein DisA with diadenylate cyclase activity
VKDEKERKIGALFIVSEADSTMRKSRCLILDPLKHHPDEAKQVKFRVGKAAKDAILGKK